MTQSARERKSEKEDGEDVGIQYSLCNSEEMASTVYISVLHGVFVLLCIKHAQQSANPYVLPSTSHL